MKKKGFVFWDVLMSMSLIGLIVFICFPLLISGIKRYASANTYSEMNYLGEYIFERLNCQDDYSKALLTDLKKDTELAFEDLEDYYLNRYNCKLVGSGENRYLWEIKLTIYPKKGNKNYVEFKGSVPKQ